MFQQKCLICNRKNSLQMIVISNWNEILYKWFPLKYRLLITGTLLLMLASLASAQVRPPNFSPDAIPETSFTCEDKITGGYYADQEADCQLFHVCVQVSEYEVRKNPMSTMYRFYSWTEIVVLIIEASFEEMKVLTQKLWNSSEISWGVVARNYKRCLATWWMATLWILEKC